MKKLQQVFALLLPEVLAATVGLAEKVLSGCPNRIKRSYSDYQVSVCCLVL